MYANFYKYVTASEEDKDWGLFINVAGVATVEKKADYPPKGHPSGYAFNWKNGRVLQEYQLNYITEGYGVFENRHGKYRVSPGTIMVIFPGEWHRYRPLKGTGWKEHYIGFQGQLVPNLFKSEFFKKEIPLIKMDFIENLNDIFYHILENLKNEKAGYQLVCSGLIMAYIGYIISSLKNKEFEGKDIEKKIQQARFIIRENLDKNIDIVNIASELNIGYSYFRKMFKKYTGISPLQYHLQLRIKKSEELLMSTNKSVKEIAYELGFVSIFYFTRVFKSKTGLTPTEIRKSIERK